MTGYIQRLESEAINKEDDLRGTWILPLWIFRTDQHIKLVSVIWDVTT